MSKTSRAGMTKPMAWLSVGAGVGMVVVGGLQFAFHAGPLPRGIFLALAVAYLITALINLKRAYRA
jgi:hypothetical protein